MERMENKSDMFCDKYDDYDKQMLVGEVGNKIGLSSSTINSYFNEYKERFSEGTHYKQVGNRRKYYESSIEIFKQILEEKTTKRKEESMKTINKINKDKKKNATNKQNETKA